MERKQTITDMLILSLLPKQKQKKIKKNEKIEGKASYGTSSQVKLKASHIQVKSRHVR